jgi:transposase
MTTISVPLNLSQVNVTNIVTNNDDLIVSVESTELSTCCKDCGKQITHYHSLNKTVTLNHLSAFGKPVYIKFQPIRYQCTDCNSTTTQQPDWYQSKGHCTQLYAEYILDLLVNSTIQDVYRQENLSYKRVMTIIKQHIPNKIDWSTINELKTLGIDEISLKKDTKTSLLL